MISLLLIPRICLFKSVACIQSWYLGVLLFLSYFKIFNISDAHIFEHHFPESPYYVTVTAGGRADVIN